MAQWPPSCVSYSVTTERYDHFLHSTILLTSVTKSTFITVVNGRELILMVTIIIYFPLPVADWRKYNGLFESVFYTSKLKFVLMTLSAAHNDYRLR
jgi:hypothetical protein